MQHLIRTDALFPIQTRGFLSHSDKNPGNMEENYSGIGKRLSMLRNICRVNSNSLRRSSSKIFPDALSAIRDVKDGATVYETFMLIIFTC